MLADLNDHKASLVKQVAATRGARVLWLVPYSPDFSPTEQCWSKIKTALGAAKAHTREELEQALARAIDHIMKYPRPVQALRLQGRIRMNATVSSPEAN